MGAHWPWRCGTDRIHLAAAAPNGRLRLDHVARSDQRRDLFHLTKLGIALPAVDDHGELFALAAVVFVGSAIVLNMHREELPMFRRIVAGPGFLARS